MGSSFSAIHLRTRQLDAAAACVASLFAPEGFTLLAADDGAGKLERRRVVLVPKGDWITVADDDTELDPGRYEPLAAELSKRLDAPAVTVLVSHSDHALISAFERGQRLGSVDVPGDARATPDGDRVVRLTFLAPLVADERVRLALSDPGVRADATFVEDFVEAIADALGLRDGLRGARYLLEELPEDARVLCFERPASQIRPTPSHDTGASVRLEIEVCAVPGVVAGYPLSDQRRFSVWQTSGPPSTGVVIEIQRASVDGVDLSALRAWNPRIRNRSSASSSWTAALVAQGDVLRVTFDEARLANVPPPTMDASLPPHLASAHWSEASRLRGESQLSVALVGLATQPGRHVIRVRALAGGAASPWTDIAVNIQGAARKCLLPEGPAAHPRLPALYTEVAGVEYAVGWLSFACAWSDVAAVVLGWVEALAPHLIQGSSALKAQITSVGRHPTCAARLASGDRLAGAKWRSALGRLKEEAVVQWEPEGSLDEMLRLGREAQTAGEPHPKILAPGSVTVAHQPRGSTLFTERQRAELAKHVELGGAVPIDVIFAVRRPADARALVATLERIVEEAARTPGCLDGLIGAAGAPFSLVGPTPYEALAGVHLVWNQIAWRRAHARGPAWRVLLPSAIKPPRLVGSVSLEEGGSCSVLRGSSPDPFSMSDDARTAVEETLLPLVGTAGDASRFRAELQRRA